MSAALAVQVASYEPSNVIPLRAKPLRAGDRPKKLHPTRARARELCALVLSENCERWGIGNWQLAEAIRNNSDKAGSKLKETGDVNMGEAVLDFPIAAGPVTALELLRRRLRNELSMGIPGDVADRWRQALAQIDQLEATLTHP